MAPKQSTIKAIERGAGRPRLDIVVALAEGLDVSLEAFLPRRRRPGWEAVALAFDLSLKDATRLRTELDRRHKSAEIASNERVIERLARS